MASRLPTSIILTFQGDTPQPCSEYNLEKLVQQFLYFIKYNYVSFCLWSSITSYQIAQLTRKSISVLSIKRIDFLELIENIEEPFSSSAHIHETKSSKIKFQELLFGNLFKYKHYCRVKL